MKNEVSGDGKRRSNKSKGPRRPVSERFYDDISRRVAAAANFLSDPESQTHRSLQQIDYYLKTGNEPTMACGLDSVLIFKLLKPELDRAKRRSMRARESAERRRRERAEAAAREVEARLTEATADAELPVNESGDTQMSIAGDTVTAAATTGHDKACGPALFADEFLAVPAVSQRGTEVGLEHRVDVFVEEAREVVGQCEGG